MSKVLCSLVIMILAGSTSAQDRIGPPRLAVKWSPWHLIYFYPTIQVAVEHKLIKNVSLQYDLGVVFDPPLASYEDYRHQRGFRGIAELRYYIPSPPKIPFYIAAEYYYTDIRFNRSNAIGYECGGEDCLYYEYVTYGVRHKNQGVGLKYGILLFPGWNRNRSFFFDCNVGIAYRSLSYHSINLPQSENVTSFKNDDFILFRPSEKNRREFRPVVGVRIGYSFNKKD
jgi:hypothetical protein